MGRADDRSAAMTSPRLSTSRHGEWRSAVTTVDDGIKPSSGAVIGRLWDGTDDVEGLS